MRAEGSILSANAVTSKWRLSTLALLAALAIEIYWLIFGLPFFRDDVSPPQTPPIAELVSHRNQVSVQNPGDLVWSDVGDGSTLYRRQSVLTLDKSSAELAFLDGTGFILDQNTLVLLDKSPGDDSFNYKRITLTLVRGTIHKINARQTSELLKRFGIAGATPELEVRVGDYVVPVLPATELTLHADPELSGEAKVTVVAGELDLKSPAGRVKMKKGEEASFLKTTTDSAPISRRAPFVMISPRADDVVEFEPGVVASRVKFRWIVDPRQMQDSPLELQTSTDPEFTKDVYKTLIGSTFPPLESVQASLDLPVSPEPREWYWRVRAIHTGLTSRPVSFTLQPIARPQLLFPRKQGVVSAQAGADFAWTEVPGARSYEVQIGTRKHVTEGPLLKVGALGLGALTWKVRARYRDRSTSPWSEERSLIVVQALRSGGESELPPPPKKLMDPEIRKAEPAGEPAPRPSHSWLRIWDWLRIVPSAWAEEPDWSTTYNIRLSWTPVAGVGMYRVQVSQDPEFQHVVAEADVNETSWVWAYRLGMENLKGEAYYRVASISETGEAGKFSKGKLVPIPEPLVAAAIRARAAQNMLLSDAAPSTPDVAPSRARAASERKVEAGPGIRVDISALLHTGLGSLSQSSKDSSLSSVGMDGPFLQQKLEFQADWVVESDPPKRAWTLAANAGVLSFHKSGAHRTFAQPDEKAFETRLDVLRWAGNAGIWERAWGLRLDQGFRWIKTGAQSVAPKNGVSLGPSAMFVRKYGNRSLYIPEEIGARAGLPLTGIFMGGPFGAEGSMWGEWKAASWKKSRLSVRLEGELAYERWSQPQGTSLLSWSFWVAPHYYF